MIIKKMDVFDATTIEYQCTKCNHLCKLLLDSFVKPRDIVSCKKSKFILN